MSSVREGLDPMARGLALLLFLRVCSDGAEHETLEWVRNHHAAGTQNNWQISDEPHRRPVKCDDIPGRTHYFFVC